MQTKTTAINTAANLFINILLPNYRPIQAGQVIGQKASYNAGRERPSTARTNKYDKIYVDRQSNVLHVLGDFAFYVPSEAALQVSLQHAQEIRFAVFTVNH
jgi:hypothetical protein